MTEKPGVRRVVGTAGHIDHGKSTLIRALTGTDPDRLPEEKRRGITIDLGFAHAEVDGAHIGFVDVPGHERFVRNMLAGAGGIDAVLLVVSAEESVMPQTREHFDICRLLGVERGIVAITKSDAVDAQMIELVRLEVAELVAGSFLEHAPVIAVSGRTGEGLPELRAELARVVREAAGRDATMHSARLPIDRVFSIRGFGTVVTGTLVAGTLNRDEELEILPQQRRVRARGVEVHGEAHAAAEAGQRTSVNVTDTEVSDVSRGDQLGPPGSFRPTRTMLVELSLLDSAPPLRDGARIHLHLHSGETVAAIRLIAVPERTLEPGATAFVKLRLQEPMVAVAGDRFVARRYSPLATIGGGRVLDPFPGRIASTTSPATLEPLRSPDAADAFVWWARRQGQHGLTLRDAMQRTGLTADAAAALIPGSLIAVSERGPWLHADVVQATRREAMTLLEAWFRQQKMTLGMPKQTFLQKLLDPGADPAVASWVLADLAAEKIAIAQGDVVDVPGRRKELAGVEGELAKRIENAFRETGLKPPLLGDLVRGLSQKPKIVEGMIGYLARSGVLVRLAEGLFVHRDAVNTVREQLVPHAGETFDIAWFKDRFGLSRKIAIPLLEHLDASGVTRRVGDKRQLV